MSGEGEPLLVPRAEGLVEAQQLMFPLNRLILLMQCLGFSGLRGILEGFKPPSEAQGT